MALTLREIRENTQSARDLMAVAQRDGFAVGAFSLDNQETLKAVVRAALAKNSPVLVDVSHSEVKSIGIDNIRDMVDNYKREFGVEIYINLDHSPTVEAAVEGVEAGFEFIHLDVLQSDPKASEKEIITRTKLIVDYARLTGAMVESEPDYFVADTAGYGKIKQSFTKPEAADHFVKSTGIDIFAAAAGNLHDNYPVPKLLDVELLQKLRQTVKCNISLHGGTGTPGHYFADAAQLGISKISVSTELRQAFRAALEKILKENPDETAIFKLMDEVIGSVQQVVEEKIDLFGSAGKARSPR